MISDADLWVLMMRMRATVPHLAYAEFVDLIEELQCYFEAEEKGMPGLLDKAVTRIKSRGVPTKSAWPIAVASLQKAGDLKPGSVKATKQGAARNQMSRAQRKANPPK